MANLEYQAKRIRFSLKKSSRERIFARLKEYNDRMRKLLECNDRTSTLKATHKIAIKSSASANGALDHFWKHAKTLHKALAGAWQCGCKSHQANLQLKHRKTNDVEFNILFGRGSGKDETNGWTWQETEVRMRKKEDSPTPATLFAPSLEDVHKGPAVPKHRIMSMTRPSGFSKFKKGERTSFIDTR